MAAWQHSLWEQPPPWAFPYTLGMPYGQPLGMGGPAGFGPGMIQYPQPLGAPAGFPPAVIQYQQPAEVVGPPAPQVPPGGAKKNLSVTVLSPDGHVLGCLIDTGSPGCLVQRNCLRRHFPHAQIRRIQNPEPLAGFGGFDSWLTHKVILPIRFEAQGGGQVEAMADFFITDNVTFPEILVGMDFLEDNHMNLIWDNGDGGNRIEWQGHRLPLKRMP